MLEIYLIWDFFFKLLFFVIDEDLHLDLLGRIHLQPLMDESSIKDLMDDSSVNFWARVFFIIFVIFAIFDDFF